MILKYQIQDLKERVERLEKEVERLEKEKVKCDQKTMYLSDTMTYARARAKKGN